MGLGLALFTALVLASTASVWADEAASTAQTVAAAPASLQGFMGYADFTWVNGNTREHDYPLDNKYFSPEILFDTNYVYDFAKPIDHTISGSTCVEHSGQIDVEHLGLGGDLHIPVGSGGDYVRGRIMTEFGNYAEQIPRDDESPARGSWPVVPGVQYLTEAYGGYHFNIPGTDGLNIDVGQFPSYVGLFSFYDSENWCYQASYVSSNTPWFFTGMRVQFFPNDTLKIEPWVINGWQTYGMFNEGVWGLPMDLGMEIRWAPNPDMVFIFNQYAGTDNPNSPNCVKYHTDDSAVIKYLDDPKSNGITKMALSFTCDAGMQQGPLYTGLDSNNHPIYVNVGPDGPNAESFIGFMAYDRTWFAHDTLAFTVGGGWMSNPGRYLALLPPIDGDTGANYFSDPNATGAFTEAPGLEWQAWDFDLGFQIMPSQYLTWDVEYTHRFSDQPYFVGSGGITSSDGWQAGAGTGSAQVPFKPDLVNSEDLVITSLMLHI